MKQFTLVLLLVIVLIGGGLRFTDSNWDSYQALHPDERNIAWAVTRIHFFDEMNPKFFAYGGLPIYLYRAIGEIVVGATHDPDWLASWGKISVIGRSVSAVLSTLSIILIYQVGTLYFSSSVGLLAAGLLAFSPWAIREAHFGTTETMLVFFLLLLTKQSFGLLKHPVFLRVIKIGIVLGLAIGAKTTSLLFTVIPFTAIWFTVFHKGHKKEMLRVILSRIALSFVLLLCAFFIFLVTSPYTVLDFGHFSESMQYETGVALGKLSVPYTLQFVGTSPYIYQFITMIWQSGWVAIIGVLGLFGLLIKLFRHVICIGIPKYMHLPAPSHGTWATGLRTAHQSQHAAEILILIIFPCIYAAWAGSWFAKFGRYNVPFLPFATLAASWFMVSSLNKIKQIKFLYLICLIAYLFIGISSLLWGLANWTIYLRPQTRLAATYWINKHISNGSTIYTEHWNDGLPLSLPNEITPDINRELLTVYNPDNEEKLTYYTTILPKAQFIILSTRRIWATMPHLSQKYPLTNRFYQQLLTGNLGYTEVADFTSYPQLFGIQINDDASEESVQVFDHPTVRIFQNTERLSEQEMRNRLITSDLHN